MHKLSRQCGADLHQRRKEALAWRLMFQIFTVVSPLFIILVLPIAIILGRPVCKLLTHKGIRTHDAI